MHADDASFLEELRDLQLRLRVTGTSAWERGRLTAAAGGRVDFHSHRRYERRDPPRAVDWRVFARTGALVAKDFVDERSLELHVFLDRSGSMGLGAPTKLHVATRFTLGVGYLALAAGATVSIWTAPEGNTSRPFRPLVHRLFGQHHFQRLWQLLADLHDQGPLLLHPALTEWTAELPRRCESVVVSDFLCPTLKPESFAGLGQARRTTAVQILGAQDLKPELSGPVFLEDSETGQSRLVIVDSAERTAHSRGVAERTLVPQDWCRRHHQGWLSHEPSRPVIELVRTFAQASPRR